MYVYLYAAPAAAAINRYLLQAPAFSSKPTARRCCYRSTGQTDTQTDGRTLDRFMSLTAYYADRVTAARIMCTGT